MLLVADARDELDDLYASDLDDEAMRHQKEARLALAGRGRGCAATKQWPRRNGGLMAN